MTGWVRRFYEHFEEVLGSVLLAAMALLAFVNVIARYFIHYSLAFTEEIEVALLVWLTMLGTAAGFRRAMHLGFNFVVLRFSASAKKTTVLLGSLLTIIVFCVLLWVGIFQIKDEVALQITTEALGIHQWWYTLAIPTGSLLVMFRAVESALLILKGKEN